MGPSNHGFKLKIDDSISFSMDYDDLYLLHCIRVKFHALVMRRMRQPAKGRVMVNESIHLTLFYKFDYKRDQMIT